MSILKNFIFSSKNNSSKNCIERKDAFTIYEEGFNHNNNTKLFANYVVPGIRMKHLEFDPHITALKITGIKKLSNYIKLDSKSKNKINLSSNIDVILSIEECLKITNLEYVDSFKLLFIKRLMFYEDTVNGGSYHKMVNYFSSNIIHDTGNFLREHMINFNGIDQVLEITAL